MNAYGGKGVTPSYHNIIFGDGISKHIPRNGRDKDILGHTPLETQLKSFFFLKK